MMSRHLLALALPFALAACGQASAQTIDVVKTPWCGCCAEWVEHLRASGFEVRVTEREDLGPVAAHLGVPDDLRSCHSASVGGYAIEGHVPAAEIRRLLAEKPEAAGLAVPGMPIGSPGMEQGDARQSYQVVLFGRDGKRRIFARY